MADHWNLMAWVSTYVASATADEQVESFVRHTDDRILDHVPELANDPVLVAELHASTRSQWRSFLNGLDRDALDVVLPPQAVDLALAIARRRLDMGVLLKIYRVAADATWDFITAVTDAIPADGSDRAEALKHLWGRAGRWINESIEQLMLIYAAENEAAIAGVFARRSETMQALLRGEAIPVDIASQELGHHLRGYQTAFVLWVDDDTSERSSEALEFTAQALARGLGAARPLTLSAGRRELWTWIATRSAPSLDRLPDIVQGGGVRVASGRPRPGVAGFRTSHREALDTQRCMVASGRPDVLTTYDEVELACLSSGNPQGMQLLIERELGGLASPDPALDPVRETLSRYLQNGSNTVVTAAELFLHRNTVRYRLAQAEELVGHPLTERRTEMDVALRCLAWRPAGRFTAPV